ncbi:MAG: binding-protein-dependent transport system inner rane component [Paenibacillaceae bacterium]|jgi:putative aldouronate transport system permease protein|nr:binding-protein-dependent transport system inner rane component [Paenibacillaceae bacterium]
MLLKDIIRNRYIYLMLLPVVVYYIIFSYLPMYGAQIAFKSFSPVNGIWGSTWIGLQHFEAFFQGIYFWRTFRNTLLISLYDILFGFPAPILLALLLNELRSLKYKRLVQSFTYMPHFISVIVVVGIMVDFLTRDGLVNLVLADLGLEKIAFLQSPEWFRGLYIGSGIWQQVGWGSIIFIAAIAGIDPTLYEAARVDGAGRFRQVMHITLPGIMPTIIILLILRLGNVMNVGYEKILLMYNPMVYETADVISTYVYRKGILDASFDYSSAVGLFNSVINLVLLVIANYTSRRVNGSGLW